MTDESEAKGGAIPITPLDLISLVSSGKAVLLEDRINHIEIVYDGIHYFLGWDSTINPNYAPPENNNMADRYKAKGWVIYRAMQTQ